MGGKFQQSGIPVDGEGGQIVEPFRPVGHQQQGTVRRQLDAGGFRVAAPARTGGGDTLKLAQRLSSGGIVGQNEHLPASLSGDVDGFPVGGESGLSGPASHGQLKGLSPPRLCELVEKDPVQSHVGGQQKVAVRRLIHAVNRRPVGSGADRVANHLHTLSQRAVGQERGDGNGTGHIAGSQQMLPGLVGGAEAGQLAVGVSGVEKGQAPVRPNTVSCRPAGGSSLKIDKFIGRIESAAVRGDPKIVSVFGGAAVLNTQV